MVPGKPERWCDLGPEYTEWIRTAASAQLEATSDITRELFASEVFQAHAAARLRQLTTGGN